MIPIPPELEAAILEAARERGISEAQFVLDAVQDALQGSELHPDWGPIIARRNAEIEDGTAVGIPAAQAFEEVRADLRRRRATA